MSKSIKPQQEEPGQAIESAINRTEQFIEKNGKTMLIALVTIVLCIGGYFTYQSMYKTPRMESASEAMFRAQYQFERDSFDLALRGNASFAGFEQIISEHGSLPQGNIAKHYAGVCCLYLGQYQAAIDHFKTFSAVDGSVGTIITAQNFGMMGDAHVELGQMDQALQMYEKAVAQSDNSDTAPKYLKKAAMVNETLGNHQAALDQYSKIRDLYGETFVARDIAKYISQVEQKL